ncbi:MAG: hypothetical protein KAS32_29960 [Candidatus Peribacteraceae bacterium]|nr:hypothetical protein [Candidatus Peribacteraceae bacterium]
MTKGWHVTAQNIKQWTQANRRQAQELLPLLVRKLIIASSSPSSIHFPTGDSISTSGYDGTLTVTLGNAFIPSGNSVWELSTESSINVKANEDYAKRTEDSLGYDKKTTSFIFVTTRAWINREKWEKEIIGDDKWANVRGINADDLEAWLEQCSAVHIWFARLIGNLPVGAWDSDHAWENWSGLTQPACSSELVIAGRNESVTDLINILKETPSMIRVWGESKEEAYAFVLATINHDEQLSVRLLVVKSQTDFDVLIDSSQSLVLIPDFANPSGLSLAIDKGHSIVLSASLKLQGGQKPGIILGKAEKKQQITALIDMGLDENMANEVVVTCRGHLKPLRRHPSLSPTVCHNPDWAKSENANIILSALFVGAWTSNNKNDCEKLAFLAGTSYDDLEHSLQSWSISDDPPVCRIGNAWHIFSRPDAWLMLSPHVSENFLNRFGKIAQEVLQEIDPRFDLPPEERWMAAVYDKVTTHSELMRHGIVEMLAMLGGYGDRDCQNIGMNTVQDQVSWWVREIIIENMSGIRWSSISKEIALLAESAPETFLEAVSIGLQGENPPIMDLFIVEGDMGGCPHANLLWALERVSWKLEHLSQVSHILIKLSRLDTGGNYSNRPSSSLKQIYLGWLPQTKATLDQRLEIIDGLLRSESESSWQLLINLIPEMGKGISTPIDKPKFRDWADGWEKGVTQAEYYQHINAIVEKMLRHVDEKPNLRWPEMVTMLPKLPKTAFELVNEKLKTKNSDEFSDGAISVIYNELRVTICRHLKYPDANWSLPSETIDQLLEIYYRFVPENLVLKYQYLFYEYIPEIVNVTLPDNRKEQESLIENIRVRALEEIWNNKKITGIKDLASKTTSPWYLGISLSHSDFAFKIEDSLLSWLAEDSDNLVQIVTSYIRSKYNDNCDWLKGIKKQYIDFWSYELWAKFCLGLPFGKAVFDFLGILPDEVSHHYWRIVNRCYLTKDESFYIDWVIEKLLFYKRPFAALQITAHILQTIKNVNASSDLMAKVLEQIIIEPTDFESNTTATLRSDIGVVLKTLQINAEIDEQRLAHIEWMFIHYFRYNDEIKPQTLLKEINSNPDFFVHLICLAYKANPPIEEELQELSSEIIEQQAENAHYTMEQIDQLPGQNDNDINISQLQEWIERVREECKQRNRVVMGDQCIGNVLSYSPLGSDDIWPHEAVRNLLENLENREIEKGIEVSRYNQRGAHMKLRDEGGKQEREIALKYKEDAQKIQHQWPRTGTMLRRMEKMYIRDATRGDLDFE